MSRAVRSMVLATLVMALALVLASPRAAMAQEGSHPPAAAPDPAHPAAAHDDQAAHEKGELIPPLVQGLPAMIAAFIVFGTVFFVLKKKAWPAISKSLDERAEKIRSEIEAAEMAQRQAKAALEQYEKNLAEARAEAQKMLTDAVAQQQTLVAEQKAKAEGEISQMRDRARRDIEQAKRAAIEEIYAAAIGQATAMASKILRREVSAGDQQRLVEETLAELQALGRSN